MRMSIILSLPHRKKETRLKKHNAYNQPTPCIRLGGAVAYSAEDTKWRHREIIVTDDWERISRGTPTNFSQINFLVNKALFGAIDNRPACNQKQFMHSCNKQDQNCLTPEQDTRQVNRGQPIDRNEEEKRTRREKYWRLVVVHWSDAHCHWIIAGTASTISISDG